jgi:hypothetical protein
VLAILVVETAQRPVRTRLRSRSRHRTQSRPTRAKPIRAIAATRGRPGRVVLRGRVRGLSRRRGRRRGSSSTSLLAVIGATPALRRCRICSGRSRRGPSWLGTSSRSVQRASPVPRSACAVASSGDPAPATTGAAAERRRDATRAVGATLAVGVCVGLSGRIGHLASDVGWAAFRIGAAGPPVRARSSARG